MRDHEVAHRLVGPLPKLGNVLLGARRKMAGIHHEHGTIANDDGRVAFRKVRQRVWVLDRVHTLPEPSHRALWRETILRE